MAVEQKAEYLLSTDQDSDWGLIITTVGHQSIVAGANYPSVNHPSRYLFSREGGRVLNEYQLVYISSGSGTFISENHKEIKINHGDMFLLFPGEWHNYAPTKDVGWCESWIGFKGENMNNRVNSNFFSVNKPIFNLGVNDNVVNLFKQGVLVAQQQKSGYQQVLAGIVNMLLGLTYSFDKQNIFENLKVSTQINQAKIFIQENICSPDISSEKIAQEVGMGYSWFRRIFKEYTGFSPIQYILELKIYKAKELLTNSCMTCQEIAYEVGFESPNYFSIAFKKRCKMTPNAYRNITQTTK